MPVYREPFSQLNQRQLTLLIKRTHLYAVKILGNRRGRSPVLDPEDLMMRAFEDTMVGADRPGNGAEAKGRLWDPTARSLWAHLRGCIRSYISHYGESSEGIRRVDIKSQPRTIFDDQDLDGEGIDVGDLLTDEITPEDELEAEQTNQAIDRRVQEEGEPMSFGSGSSSTDKTTTLSTTVSNSANSWDSIPRWVVRITRYSTAAEIG